MSQGYTSPQWILHTMLNEAITYNPLNFLHITLNYINILLFCVNFIKMIIQFFNIVFSKMHTYHYNIRKINKIAQYQETH